MINENNPLKDEAKILDKEADTLRTEAKILEKEVNSADKVSKNVQAIVGAIIIAGLLIAGAVIYSGGGKNSEVSGGVGSPDNVVAVTKTDHIRGDMKAKVVIVEYSDLECPYCKTFHNTMKQVMAEYGPSGNVAWVYRHFPLTAIHPKAVKEAEASECAAELGGNDKFWVYIDRIFSITPSNNGLDPAELHNTAEHVGLDVNKFSECLASGKYASKVEKQGEQAVEAGARGTPYSVIISRKGEKTAIDGAVPYEAVKQMIEKALQ